jgi:hypothetical protein
MVAQQPLLAIGPFWNLEPVLPENQTNPDVLAIRRPRCRSRAVSFFCAVGRISAPIGTFESKLDHAGAMWRVIVFSGTFSGTLIGLRSGAGIGAGRGVWAGFGTVSGISIGIEPG